MDESKSKKIINIAVGILILLVVLEAGYFLYTRYIGPISWQGNNSSDESGAQTSNSLSVDEQYNQARSARVGDGNAPIRQISQDKLDSFMRGASSIPSSLLANSYISNTYKGSLIASGPDTLEEEGVTYVYLFQLISASSEQTKFRFSQQEMDKMTVNLKKEDDSVEEVTYKDLKIGDRVAISIFTDLLDWREGQDTVTVDIIDRR